MFMSVKQAAVRWGISDRRTRVLCSEGKFPVPIRRDDLENSNRCNQTDRWKIILNWKVSILLLTEMVEQTVDEACFEESRKDVKRRGSEYHSNTVNMGFITRLP